MTQYVLTVVGDTNDADYITSTTDINDDDTIDLPVLADSKGGVYQTAAGHTDISFIKTLAKVLKMPRETRHKKTVLANELVDDIKTYLKMTKLQLKSSEIKAHGETVISFKYKVLECAIDAPVAPKLPLQDLIDKLRDESLAKTEERKALKAQQDKLEGEIFELNNDNNILAKALVVSEARLNKK